MNRRNGVEREHCRLVEGHVCSGACGISAFSYVIHSVLGTASHTLSMVSKNGRIVSPPDYTIFMWLNDFSFKHFLTH